MPAPIIVITGPPGAGKTTVATLIANNFPRSAVVAGDDFFNYLHNGKIPPWLPESHQQNTAVTTITAKAAAEYARQGWTTILEGIFGPWFLPTINSQTAGIDLHYFVLRAPLETCIKRFSQREPHTPTEVVEKMHSEFSQAEIEERHLVDGDQDPTEIANAILERVRRESAVIKP